MAGLFSRPKVPAMIYQPPSQDTAAVQDAARAEAERLRKRKGMRATILTGPQGITEPAPIFKTTLG